jgi:hypothetical protein
MKRLDATFLWRAQVPINGAVHKSVGFNKSGDATKSGSTRTLGNAVKDVCNAISADRPKQLARIANEEKNSADSDNSIAKKK